MVKKFMREQRLIMGNHGDLEDAIANFNSKILIFNKKLDMNERRKEFRRIVLNCTEEDSTEKLVKLNSHP